MRQTLCGLVAAAAVAAPAALADRTQPAPGQVLALGLTQAQVVYAAAAAGDGCPTLTVWHTDVRWNARLPTGRDCPATSTGRGIAAVETAADRVLWLSYAGGNNRDWTLWTASRSAQTPKLIRFVTRDVDAPPPIVVGDTDIQLLPYAVDRTLVVLDPLGARLFTWTAPAGVEALTAGPVGIAAVLADGSVETLSLRGQLLRSDTFPPGEVRWAARSVLGTLIQLPSRLELRHGSSLRSWPLPADASQLEYAEGILVYASGGSIHALRLRDASDRVVLTPPVRPFLVEFSHRGLAWAAGSRVSFRSAATFYSQLGS